MTGPTTVSGEKLTAERPEAWAVARPAGTGNLSSQFFSVEWRFP